MSEIIYSKRQLNPIIEKYSIDPTTNVVFQTIIKNFPESTNYQIWALKAVFEGMCPIEVILRVKRWADKNQTEIKNLTKGNIVAYKNAADFQQLMAEIEGLSILAIVRDGINKFNTAQREMLRSYLFPRPIDGATAAKSTKIKKWAKYLGGIEKMPKHRREKLISTSSAIDNMGLLEEHISTALEASYTWDREDFLAYLSHNAPDCSVVFDNNNVVMISVPSFKSSKLLCGNGRTGWCLTREDRYFKQYVTEARGKQFFIFDFNKSEMHELAHVGFTVRKPQGITNAHSTTNRSLTGDGISVDGTRWDIHKVLNKLNIDHELIMRIDENKYYKWSIESALALIATMPKDLTLAYNNDNRLVVEALSPRGVERLIEHTMMDARNIHVSQNSRVFIVLDMNAEYHKKGAIHTLVFTSDQWQTFSLQRSTNAYAENMDGHKFLKGLNLTAENLVGPSNIPNHILLHKYISENREAEAVALVHANADMDVNHEFNGVRPIFKAIEKYMFNLFEAIISHAKFDSATTDALKESLLQALMYDYIACGSGSSEARNIKRMIDIILDIPTYDLNFQDVNLDSAIHVACDHEALLWVCEKLVANPNVNLNIVNDINCTALGCALRFKNIRALQLLNQRRDLVVREEDYELAERVGINLNDYITDRTISTITMTPQQKAMCKKNFELFVR